MTDAQLGLFGELVPTSAPSSRLQQAAEAFEVFWDRYPKRAGGNPKKPARAKFINIVIKERIDPRTIIEGCIAYAASRDGQDPTYTAMATTWLNQARWTCDYSIATKGRQSYASIEREIWSRLNEGSEP